MFLHEQCPQIYFPVRDQQPINKTVSEGIVMTHFAFAFAACVCLQQFLLFYNRDFVYYCLGKKSLKMPIFPCLTVL